MQLGLKQRPAPGGHTVDRHRHGRSHHEPDPSCLTSRERQVAEAITHGLTNRAIAERFGVSERTVKNQLTVIYDKLEVASRLELATLLMRRQQSSTT